MRTGHSCAAVSHDKPRPCRPSGGAGKVNRGFGTGEGEGGGARGARGEGQVASDELIGDGAGAGNSCLKLEISREKYNSEGAPEGVEVSVQPNDLSRWEVPMLEALGESNSDALREIEAAPQVVSIMGRVADPSDLNYLRDTLGLVAALLDRE